VLECVVNISEGRRSAVIGQIGAAAGASLLDTHTDPDHNRSVLTLVGEDAARAVARATVALVDLRGHSGVHPRIGALDVVPFVPLGSATLADAEAAADRFAEWAGRELALPCFRYGDRRSLPEVRRGAFTEFAPDTGPPHPHPTAGATAVGARPVLVAYNLWLTRPDLELARAIARRLRTVPGVRALGLPVGERVQVSMNLVDPDRTGPGEVYREVAALAENDGAEIDGAELVGLIPERVLERVPVGEWERLDLARDRTIEARLAAGGFTPAA
jgi:glutamate formiminotransferase